MEEKNEMISDIIESNVIFPVKLLEFGTLHNVSAFINTDTFFSNHPNYYSLSEYSLSKRQFLDLLRTFADKLTTINLKLEHVYGEKDTTTKFIPYVIKELLIGAEELNLTNGEQKRDFIYVQDVVDVFTKLIKKIDDFSTGFYEYEVGSGKSITIKELVSQINSQILNANTILNFGALPYHENEIIESSADITKIKNDIGWSPQTSLEEGVKRTIDWYKEKIDSGDLIQ